MQKKGTQTRKVITGESFDTEWKTGHVHTRKALAGGYTRKDK